MNYDTSNEMFGLAAELISHSSYNVFLTGKAGTGKTTFLKYLRENCAKQMAVVAPTGVAAVNAGGVTIHSFFQLPLSPFTPEIKGFLEKNDHVTNPHSLISRLRMNNEKKRLLHELELLIIDEISMVRCDVLDAIDLVLRHIRHRHHERFGGVQVLFIGDMFQLPPVKKDDEWKVLSAYYNSPYFFDSKVMQEEPPVYIEFTKVYRQSDEQFINLLNQVRNNQIDETGETILQSRYQPGFQREGNKDYIVLTTHNEKARNINASELAKLRNKLFTYRAETRDDFPATAYPADELLQLKVGAQVMFIKNDMDKNKRYFNGKIGVITKLFEFDQIVNEIIEIQGYILRNSSSFNPEIFPWTEELLHKAIQFQKTSEKFHIQLKSLFLQTKKPEDNFILQERIKAATVYFVNELITINEFLSQSPAVTDSRLHAKAYNEEIKEIFTQFSVKKFLLEGFSGKFDIEAYHRRKKAFVLPEFTVNSYAGVFNQKSKNAHPELYYELKKLRDSICLKKDLPVYLVAGSRTLDEMVTYLPQTIDELEQISGFGKSKLNAYGKGFLAIIQNYCDNHKLSSRIAEKTPKRRRRETGEPKKDTKAESFRLYQNGKKLIEIAKERNLAVETVEGHLAHYVQKGEIRIDELISREKFIVIEPILKEFHNSSLIPIKEKLGETVSYGEIKFVLAWQEYQKNLSSHVHH